MVPSEKAFYVSPSKLRAAAPPTRLRMPDEASDQGEHARPNRILPGCPTYTRGAGGIRATIDQGGRREGLDVPPDAPSGAAGRFRAALQVGVGGPTVP